MKNRIDINNLGYMIGVPKNAVCKVTAGIFYIVDAQRNTNVYAGRLSHPFFDRESGETVRLADFSDFNVKGKFFIRAGYRRSEVFEISEAPYKDIRTLALNGIYFNRCGYNFESNTFSLRSDKRFERKECHTSKIGGRDISGGWHCFGGYERDLSAVCLTVADMIYALKLFSESFDSEEKEMLTDECRWGIEWLLKMQDNDGGVFESVMSVVNIDVPTAPDEDETNYKLGDKTCLAALRFTATAALASNYFSKSDPKLSKILRNAAEKCWIWIVQTDEYSYYTSDNGSFSPDGEGVYYLDSDFMWAMCEMYSLTGNESFARMISSKYLHSEFSDFGSSCCGGFAALSYLLTDKTKDRGIDAFVRKKIIYRADRLKHAASDSGYRISVSAGKGFVKGSNYNILSDCMMFISAYLISGEDKYLECATDQFAYIFGANPLGISFMTGTAENQCRYPSHTLSLSLEGDGPIEGMIVGGASTSRDDNYSKWHIGQNCPPSKCYVDKEFSYSTNEPSVHYTAPIIFISAFYDKVGRSALSGVKKNKI